MSNPREVSGAVSTLKTEKRLVGDVRPESTRLGCNDESFEQYHQANSLTGASRWGIEPVLSAQRRSKQYVSGTV
jgi:hypothetical protein